MAGKYDLNSAQVYEAEQFIVGRITDPGRTASDNRMFLNAVVFVLCSGKRWSSLHPRYGNWKTVYRRFHRYKQAGIWEPLFEKLTNSRSNPKRVQYLELYLQVAQRSAGRPHKKPGNRRKKAGSAADS